MAVPSILERVSVPANPLGHARHLSAVQHGSSLAESINLLRALRCRPPSAFPPAGVCPLDLSFGSDMAGRSVRGGSATINPWSTIGDWDNADEFRPTKVVDSTQVKGKTRAEGYGMTYPDMC